MLSVKNKKLALCIMPLMVASLLTVGCGGNNASSNNSASSAGTQGQTADTQETAEGTGESGGPSSDSDSFFPFGETFYDGRWYSGDLIEPEEQKTAAEIYSKVKYTPQMFYGDYRLNHPNDGIQTSYASNVFLHKCEWIQGGNVSTLLVSYKISSIPYRIVAGNAELDNPLITDTSYNWCQLYFAVEGDNNNGVSIDAAYEVEGNTITFTPVASWSFDEETAQLEYTFEQNTLSYTFEFCGPRLTLSTETSQYTLIERDFTSWRSYVTEESVSVESSLSQNSRKIGDITGIDLTVALDEEGNLNNKKSAFSLKVDDNGQTKSCNGIAKWDEDGLFTFSYEYPSGQVHSYQLVMFYCGFDGLVFSDGSRNFYYLSTFLSEASVNHYTIEDLGANITEEDAEELQYLTDEEIEEILETRENLLEDFKTAFNSNGIAAQIDEETGEIVLDSSILFALAQAELSDEGKDALKAFITTFANVISDEKYDGFISKVEVQGHTDTDGNYDYNLELSQQRAESVKNYCLDEAPLSDDAKAKLSKLLVPVGYSYDHPVYFEDGTVDKDSSRRVEFVFYINLLGQ